MALTRYVFDIEANGLLDDNPDKIWYAVVEDLHTGKKWRFSDYTDDLGELPLKKLPKRLAKADELVGQNIIGYDLIVIERILGWKSPWQQKKIDTMLISQSLDQRRFGYDGHSLERWGEHFGFPKVEIEADAWHKWDERYPKRCNDDVEINKRQYIYLMKELKAKAAAMPLIKRAIAAEHYTAEFFADAQEQGWPFNRAAAVELLAQMDKELQAYERELEPQMPVWIKRKDNKIRKPKFIRSGHYAAYVTKPFGLDPSDAIDNRTIDGPYSLLKYEEPALSKTEHVKRWLFKLGWVPLQYNTKREGRQMVQTSPKLCEESLHAIGPIGIAINDYNTTSSRASILRKWIAGVDANGCLHGDVRVIGTPTFRCRHKIVTNVPGATAKWGPEVRALFVAEPGYIIVGADSSGNQARALCHYVDNDAFTERYLSSDLHNQNMAVLGCTRPQAKRFLYAYLFGASDAKLGLYLTNRPDKNVGATARAKFEKSLPGLGDLLDHLMDVYQQTKGQVRAQNPKGEYNQGYLPDLAGRRVYSDSPHKLLNYLLQGCEAITCKAALMWAVVKFREEGIWYRPLIHYHDEFEVMVKPKDAKRAAEIMEEGFREAPKEFGVMIMDGEAKIGLNWMEVH